jgi:hypothetical protein
MSQFANLVLYQIGWFACVLGAAWHSPWLGMSIALCLVGVHFWLVTDRLIQLKLGLAAVAIGLVIDTLQLWGGVFAFSHGTLVPWLPPLWISVLWMQFATTLRYSMRWLSGRYALSAVFGLFGAPLAFFAGERLGAVEFLPPRLVNFAILGALWSFVVPLLVYVADRLAIGSSRRASYRWSATTDHAVA